MYSSIFLLILSNFFMTYAWYGHLKAHNAKPLWLVILISWGVAFFEYCLQVPANRIGYSYYSLPQLKVMQEVITLVIFVLFSYFFMGIKMSMNYVYAAVCLVGAVYFIFKDGLAH